MALVRLSLLAALFILFAGPAFVVAETDQEKEAREEALRTVMYPWSKDAKTADLKLSKNATEFVNVWLDACRNFQGGRAKPSERFMGNAHSVWDSEPGSLRVRFCFVNLTITSAVIEINEATAITALTGRKDFIPCVKVEGDEPGLLKLWGLMLATQVADHINNHIETQPYKDYIKKGGKPLDVEAWKESNRTIADALVAGFKDTEFATEQWIMEGMPGSDRRVILNAVKALVGTQAAGALIRKLYDMIVEQDDKDDISAAAMILLKCRGKEAEDFAIEEIKSGEQMRVGLAISYSGPDYSPRVFETLVQCFNEWMETNDIPLVQAGVSGLEASAQHGNKKALEALEGNFDKSVEPVKYSFACALMRLKTTKPEPRKYLEDLLVALQKDHPDDGRIFYIKELLKIK